MAFNSREGQLFLLLEAEAVSWQSRDIFVLLYYNALWRKGEELRKGNSIQDRQRSARHGDRVHEVRFRGESRDSREGERRR